MNYYESTLNDLVMFSVLDITAFCMLNKVLSAFVLPRSSITFSLVSDEYPPKTSIMMLLLLLLLLSLLLLSLLLTMLATSHASVTQLKECCVLSSAK